MRKTLLAMSAVGFILTLVPTEASAWVCRADSASAYGWGSNYYRGRAVSRALYECSIRTPRGQTCYLSWCR
jgi:hypothetical protein